ncbi:MAG: methylated-DNA--[protein]-cysteine S-methyltransferase [Desulfitobacteriia bacterium]|jgi:methylated-DNA-[protein]-cysteine S-methyltransferase
MFYTCTIETPLGEMIGAARHGALTGLWFKDQKYFPKQIQAWESRPDHAVFHAVRSWLKNYFTGQRAGLEEFNLKLAPLGTRFQEAIWDILMTIPYGKVMTYGGIAKIYASAHGLKSMSAQAVGGAVGHNPISILIPCHRVIGANKSLTGYAGGLERKKALLSLEGVLLEGVFKEEAWMIESG